MEASEVLYDLRKARADGDRSKAQQLALRALRITSGLRGRERVQAHAAYICCLVDQGDLAGAATRVVDLVGEAGELGGEAWEPIQMLLSVGDEDAAAKLLRKSRIASFLDPWTLLQESENQAKAGRFTVGASLAEVVRDEARASGDDLDRWRAEGQLGRVLERQGRVDEALRLWAKAFSEGSPNRHIAERLSLNLEKAKRYSECLDVIQEALFRISDQRARTELQRRADRIRSQTGA